MNALSTIKEFPTPEKIDIFFQQAKEEWLSGNQDELEILAIVKATEKTIKLLLADEEIKKANICAAEKFEGKTFKHKNCQFSIKEAGTKYDYSVCNDAEWMALNIEADRIDKLKKEREKFLQSIKPSMEIYGSDGVPLNPPAKTSNTIVECRI